ncbi:hypothetical protein O181_084531 [Austropuccinia psidii MF-1]|uniref:Elongin-C n=1 Tax=Austropuccinia psidii MF-1 TaxID=1389203 RepID=A0A9Q3FR64_9BASI|nr:hypothetical protein [Austropuccinia psidii MF-1]
MENNSTSLTEYVTLVCEKGRRFILPREAAILSNTLKDMLSEDMGMLESESGVINLMHSAPVVEKLCHYMIFKYQHIKAIEANQDGSQHSSMAASSSFNFDDQVPVELALQLLECADFLDI